MKKFVRFSIVIYFLAFVISMPLMFIPPIESHAADANPIYWCMSGNTLIIGANKDNYHLQSGKDYDTANTTSVPWSANKGIITRVQFVSKITPATTKGWFTGCTKLKTIEGIENLDTSYVTDMTSMFEGCSELTSFYTGFEYDFYDGLEHEVTLSDLSGFDTSNVTNMNRMFYGCSGLTSSLNLSGWNTSKVSNMNRMFYNCSGVTWDDVSSWRTTSKVPTAYTKDEATFNEYIGFGREETSQIYWYYNKTWSTQLVIGAKEDVEKAVKEGGGEVTASSAYSPTSTSASLPLWSNNKTSATSVKFVSKISPTITYRWFNGFTHLTEIDGIEYLDTSHVTNMQEMFQQCSVLESLDLSGFNTGSVTNMVSMFSGCSGLTSLNMSGWDTRNVTTMLKMFYQCSSLESLDLSNFDTSKVTTMESMFEQCRSLTELNVSGFDTSKVKAMGHMFQDCGGLTTLDVSNFNTSKVTNMTYMFTSSSVLEKLDLSNFDTSSVTNMSYMFSGCSGLTELNVSGFDTRQII